MQNGTRGILFHITNKGGRILEQQFDKQKMSQLVKQAMGEKTPFEYCRPVSYTHLTLPTTPYV